MDVRELCKAVAAALAEDEELAAAPGFSAIAEDDGDPSAEVARDLSGPGVAAVVSPTGFDRREKSGRTLVGTARIRVDVLESVALNRADGNEGWWSAWRAAERIARVLHWRDFGAESPLRLTRMARADAPETAHVAMEFVVEASG